MSYSTAAYRKVDCDWLREPQTRSRQWNGMSGNRIKGEGGVISRVERIPNIFRRDSRATASSLAIEQIIEQANPSIEA